MTEAEDRTTPSGSTVAAPASGVACLEKPATPWRNLRNHDAALTHMHAIAERIRDGSLDLGRRHYVMGLAVGVLQAIMCGHDKIAAVEMGVYTGGGLLDLCKAAEFFRADLGIDIAVYGFDRGVGLPPPLDFRDHPEIWRQAEYNMGDQDALRAKLPDFAKLIIGDISATVPGFAAELGERKLGYVSVDVDFYSSTVDCLKILTFDRDCYMPAVPMYFDDMDTFLTYNAWCGEEAAINDFNAAQTHRKVQRRDRDFRIKRFHVAHILDHKLRTGEQNLRPGFPQRVRPF